MIAKRILEFFLILLCFLFVSCSKERLIISEEKPPVAASNIPAEMSGEAESKSLINISKTDTIEILVRADGAPGMYLGEDGKVHGFYVDLEKMVMNEMGQSYHFFSYSDISEVFQGIKTGIYHSALSVPDIPDYRAILNLSVPYEVLHYVTFIGDKNNEIHGLTKNEIIKSLFGKKVGVQTQGHIYQTLRDYKEIELIEYETTTKALEALSEGLLDAVPDVKRIGDYYRKKNNWQIKSIGGSIISHNITTSFSKALDPSLRDRYDIALQSAIKDGRVKSLWESYFGPMSTEDIP